jgi:hypothetical protein
MLFVVGSGYSFAGQVTVEALNCIKRAEKVFYNFTGLGEQWLRRIYPAAESLVDLYEPGKDRDITYSQMVDRILLPVRDGCKVCAVFYGHPGVIVVSGHEAIRRARQEGYPARMLPGISAHDALIADLGIDPGDGCQMFSATDFLTRKWRFDPNCPLILWQIGCIGVDDHKPSNDNWNPHGVRVLARYLSLFYSADHNVTIYEASPLSICDPRVQEVPISRLPDTKISLGTLLYVPPIGEPEWNSEFVDLLNSQNT